MFRSGGQLDATPITTPAAPGRMVAHAWLVTALNPKSITFFVAFLPQFIDHAAPFWPQLLIFEATFLVLAFANALGYGLVAARARRLVRGGRVVRNLNRAGGALLVGEGVLTATARAA
jgi:threonine/homoserine/homoserine lactone efflux protein